MMMMIEQVGLDVRDHHDRIEGFIELDQGYIVPIDPTTSQVVVGESLGIHASRKIRSTTFEIKKIGSVRMDEWITRKSEK